MQLGTVKFFDPKGFGFITPFDGSCELFFHASQLPGKRGARFINDGGRVSYQVGEFKGRPVAINVRLIPDSSNGSSGEPAKADA